jgi:phospholipid/cholesterol/gamma-HCH transport system permease protein
MALPRSKPPARKDAKPQSHSAIERRADGQHAVLSLRGNLTFLGAHALWDDVREAVETVKQGERLDFDMSGVDAVDGGTMALLVHLRGVLAARGVVADFVGSHENVQDLVHLYQGDIRPVRRRKRRHEGLLAQIGRSTSEVFVAIGGVLGFLGAAVLAALGLLKEPRTGNWKELWPTMERTGADAVPIVILINFLVGFVMAYQGARQLKQFGASVYVADLVGLSVTRELGPLMTAIILCGRSGASFAAELGSMKVSEEIDALRTMGFGPMTYLVLPVLTLLGDLVGMAGGALVGVTTLGLTFGGYLSETHKALHSWDVFSGVVKSVVFGLAIALIACQQGFATTGGAEGVGRRTTASVVTILFTLILLDAGFTMFFHAFNL